MNITLHPISNDPNKNGELLKFPECADIISQFYELYPKVGFDPPYIGYFAEIDQEFVGTGAIKGKPVNGQVELSYHTFSFFEKQGISTEICRQLVEIVQKHDPSVKITALTKEDHAASIRILEKNGFTFSRKFNHQEDGEVVEYALNKVTV